MGSMNSLGSITRLLTSGHLPVALQRAARRAFENLPDPQKASAVVEAFNDRSLTVITQNEVFVWTALLFYLENGGTLDEMATRIPEQLLDKLNRSASISALASSEVNLNDFHRDPRAYLARSMRQMLNIGLYLEQMKHHIQDLKVLTSLSEGLPQDVQAALPAFILEEGDTEEKIQAIDHLLTVLGDRTTEVVNPMQLSSASGAVLCEIMATKWVQERLLPVQVQNSNNFEHIEKEIFTSLLSNWNPRGTFINGDYDRLVHILAPSDDFMNHTLPVIYEDIVRNDGTALEFMPNVRLGCSREDFLITETAVGQNGNALAFAAPHLRGIPEIAIKAVSCNGLALQHAQGTLEDLRGNYDVVLAAVRKDGGALQFASEALKADKDVVLAAVSNNGHAFDYATAFVYASEALKADKDVVLAAVNQSGWALYSASEALKADKDVVLAAVNQDGDALQYASEALKADKDVVFAAVNQNGLALRHASEELQRRYREGKIL